MGDELPPPRNKVHGAVHGRGLGAHPVLAVHLALFRQLVVHLLFDGDELPLGENDEDLALEAKVICVRGAWERGWGSVWSWFDGGLGVPRATGTFSCKRTFEVVVVVVDQFLSLGRFLP